MSRLRADLITGVRAARWLAAPLLALCATGAPAAPATSTTARGVLSAVLPQPPASTPDPTALGPGWWDALAVDQPGLGDRINALLATAATAVGHLPPGRAADAAVSLERLRVSLRALPPLLAAQVEPPPAPPTLADSYTTTEFLRLDRQLRDLQADIDERRATLEISQHSLRDAQRQLDADFAAYRGLPAGRTADRTVLGVKVMAERAQVALSEVEQKARERERDALAAELGALRGLRREAMRRIVPDPERSPAQLGALAARTREKLADQRQELLQLQAQRTALAGSRDATPGATALADQRIVGAMVEEAWLSTRIALYETESDWLAATGGRMTTMRASGVEKRLASRNAEARELDRSVAEWLDLTQRALASSLHVPAGGETGEQARLREDRNTVSQQTLIRIDQLRSLLTDLRLGTAATLQSLAQYTGWRGWLWIRVLNPVIEIGGRAIDWVTATLFKIGDTPVSAFGLVRILLFLLGALVASRALRWGLGRLSARDPQRSAGLYTVGRLVHYLLIATALLIGLTSIGLDLSQLALVAGALSIGIGFGLQSTVNNFVSGLIILFERNLKIGDVVKLDSGVTGVVREINVRSTLITTNDNVDIVVPNAEFVAGKVVNYTLRDPFHRVHVPFSTEYDADKNEVRRLVIEAARSVPFTLTSEKNRDPDVWLVRLGDNGLDFELVVWINPGAVSRTSAVTASYVWVIETTLRENGIGIPYPRRDVRMVGPAAPARG